MGSFAGWMHARQYAQQTIRVYTLYVRRASVFIDLDIATTEQLEDWLETLPAGAPSRIAARKALMLYYRSTDAEPNPAMKIPRLPEPNRLPRPLTVDQQRQWVRMAHNLGGIHQVAGLLMATTGARIGEVRQAQWKDFSLTGQGYWRVRGKGARRKGIKWRQVPLHPVARDLLLEWRTPSQYVFPGARGPISDPAMRSILLEIGERAGLGRVLPHVQRHTVATHVLNETGDVLLTGELLGHADPGSTKIYTRLSPERLRAAVDGLPV